MTISFVKPHHLRTSKKGYAAVVGVCSFTTLLLIPLLGLVDLTNIALLFVLVVVLSAARWGRGAGISAAFMTVICFDFFFVPPRFSLTVEHAQYLITFFVMLVVSLVISHLTYAYQSKAFEAEQWARDAHLLQELATELSAALSMNDVLSKLQTTIDPNFHAQASLFISDGTTEALQLIKLPEIPPVIHITDVELLAAQSVYLSQHHSFANSALFESHPTLLLPLLGSARTIGVMALHFLSSEKSGSNHIELQKIGISIAAITVTAIERIHFIEITRQQELDMQSERLRSSILSTLSHDLRTPLTLLYAQAEAFAEHPLLPSDLQSRALHLSECSYRLHRMVDNLLDMARLRSGRVILHKDWQSLPELIGVCIRHLQPWLEADRIKFNFDDNIPLVEVDAVLFERVLDNLLENANKYAYPHTPINISISVESPIDIKLCISNEGSGFPADHIDKVFQLFERGPSESTIPGVGVGLAVCEAIIRAHGGRIEASNTPTGCEVAIWLSLKPMPPLPEENHSSHTLFKMEVSDDMGRIYV